MSSENCCIQAGTWLPPRWQTVEAIQEFPDGYTVFTLSVRPRTLRETSDLPWVLVHLAEAPFEPLLRAPLKSVAIKTAFLLQLALARRESLVHGCRIDLGYLRWENGGCQICFKLPCSTANICSDSLEKIRHLY